MRELLFADDSALVAHSAEEMQKIVDAFSEEYRGGWPRLVHLSADYARDSGTTTNMSMRVKGKIYRAIVLSTLLHGAEAWTVYR